MIMKRAIFDLIKARRAGEQQNAMTNDNLNVSRREEFALALM
jgi:hypothetical protein